MADFEVAIAAHRHAYAHASCSMVVRIVKNGAHLVRAVLALSPTPNSLCARTVDVGQLYACHFKLDECGLEVETFLKSLLEGRLLGPDRSFLIEREGASTQSPSFSFGFNHWPGPQSQPLQLHLAEMFGNGFGDTQLYPDPSITHQLRTAATPYANPNDLLSDFGLADVRANIHVIALSPVEFWPQSRLEGTKAQIGVLLAKRLDRSKVSVGVIASTSKGVELRQQVSASSLEWADFPGNAQALCGKFELDVPKGSLLHCFASYDCKCFSDLILTDSIGSLNPLRAIYEEFDPALSWLKDQLTSDKVRASAGDNEQAVARLLWMLGFSPIHLGAKNAQAPDVIAYSTQGSVRVVECTSGGLKIDNKLQLLLDRTKAVRDCLDRANHERLDCIPVMVTFRERADVSADIEVYEQRGVAVFTREDINGIVDESFFYPRSDFRAAELRKRIDNALKRYADEQVRIKKTVETVEKMEQEARRSNLNIGRQ